MATTPTPDNDPVVSYSAPAGSAVNASAAPDNTSDPVVSYTPPPAPGADRGALGEIGAGFARGALVDLPQMAGQALQFAGATGVGGAVRNFGAGMATRPWLTLNPAEHGAAVNALASGAEQIAPVLAPVGAVAAGIAAAPVELGAGATALLSAAGGGAIAAGAAGQQTLEKAQAKGLSPEAAQDASRLNAATTFATQVGLGLAGGKVLGIAGTALGRVVGMDAAPLAGDVLSQLSGNGGILAPTLKAAATGGAEAVGLGAAQSAASAAIEQHYGVDDTSPLDAALQSIPSMLGMTALLTPFGLAGRALQARAAGARTERLANPQTEPALRSQLADQYASAIEQQSGNAEAARNFSANAQRAIDQGQPINVSPELFNAGAVPEPTPARPTPLLPAPTNIVFPNGTVARSQQEVDNYINGLPEDQQVAARAKLMGYGAQPATPAAPEVPQPAGLLTYNPTPESRIVFPDGTVARNQQEADQYISSLPENQQIPARAAMLGYGQRTATYEAAESPRTSAIDQMREIAQSPALGLTAEQAINSVTGVDRSGLSKAQVAKRRADAQAALNEPSGVRVNDENGIERELSMGELYELRTRQAEAAAPAAAGTETGGVRTADDITRDIDTVNQTNGFDTKSQSMVPFRKRLDSLGLDKLDTPQAQVDALQTYLNDKSVKMSDGVRDRMTALLTHWQGAPEETPPEAAPAAPAGAAPEVTPALAAPPVQAETLPANISASVESAAPPQAAALPGNMPVTADTSTEQPPQAAALGENVTQSPQSHAQDTADMVDAALAGFNDRLRGGEQLTPLEQERYEDLQGFRTSLADITSGNNTNDAYAQDVSDMARAAATTPYTESYRHYRVDNPEALDPAIMFDSLRTGKLQDTLNTIATNGSTDDVKTLAQRLAPLVADTTIKYAAPDGTGAAGEFLPATNHVNVFPGGESEQTILHEAVHAAQQAQVARAEQMGIPRTQADARLKAAYNEIESIRQAVISRVGNTAYGLTNAHEFLAELNTNPDFQQLLKTAETAGKPTLWTRAVAAVKRLLGMPDARFLDRAMTANEAFFKDTPQTAGFPLPRGGESYQRFVKSPAEAAKVTDEQYSKMAGLVDAVKNVDFSKLNLQLYRASLGWKTVQFIADRIRALPEMVQSGFAAGVDAYQAAHESRRIISNLIEHPVAQYADGVRKMLHGLGDADKARDLSKLMATIGGEASRGGFDYRLNYADNIKAGRDIPAANKAYVDDIHRQFTQLQRTNPDAAKAIVDGELQNRRTLILKAATVMRNLIDASGDATMAPHAARLDLAAAELKKSTNPDASQFADGMSAALHARLQQAFADARSKLPAGILRDQINELGDMYNAQSQNPYFSLGRQGDYFVKVGFQNMDAATQAKLQDALRGTNKVLGNLLGGEDHAFFRVETQDQAMGLYNKLLKAGGDRIAPDSGAWGKLSDKVDSAFGVSPALRSLLGSLHEAVERSGLSGEAAATMRDTITRELLSMLPETSSRSALMQRRGIPGYDADFLGNFARRAMGGVQDTANMHTQPAFTAARKQMDTAIEQLNRTGTPEGRVRAQMAADEINRRFANSQKPIDNTTVNLINSLGHTFYLAASPAYLIRTTAQPFHRGLPIVGARYGFVNGAREIAKATAVALKVMGNTIADGYSQAGVRGVLDANTSFRNLGLPANEQAFIQELHDRGVLNLGQARQLQSMAMGGTQMQQDLARMASMTAQYAEMTNRLAVGLAAFRLAERAKPGDAANTEWAIQSIDRAMDNFDPSNTARQISKSGFAGRITPLLTAFMNYNLQTMQQIARTVHDGLFNRDQSAEGIQRSKEARREFAGLMATTMMISGAMGLPFANVFAGVYNTLTNDNNDPQDIRLSVQKFLENHLGHTAGEIVSHGLPRGVGFDSSTFGLENLLPGSEFLSSRQLLKDRLDEQSNAMMGPALNAGVGILNAMDRISDGYYVKGIEAALPSGLKPYFKAAELATRGYTDSKGNPIGITATPWDIGLQAIGFQSAKKATQSENEQYAMARQARLDYQRGLVEDQFYKGVTNQDQGTINSAAQALARYNMANPTQPMLDVQQGITQRLTGLALGRATGTGVNMNVRQLPSLAQELLWAQQPNPGLGMP